MSRTLRRACLRLGSRGRSHLNKGQDRRKGHGAQEQASGPICSTGQATRDERSDRPLELVARVPLRTTACLPPLRPLRRPSQKRKASPRAATALRHLAGPRYLLHLRLPHPLRISLHRLLREAGQECRHRLQRYRCCPSRPSRF